MKAYLEDARARSRVGKRIWLDAFAAEAAPVRQPAASAPPLETSPLQQRLEGERGAEPARVPRVAAVKCFVLNTETRRLHIFAAGAAKSLCGYFTLEKASALPNPALQGKAYRGKDVDPCDRCRRLANNKGLLVGGRDAAEGAESSSSEASSDTSD